MKADESLGMSKGTGFLLTQGPQTFIKDLIVTTGQRPDGEVVRDRVIVLRYGDDVGILSYTDGTLDKNGIEAAMGRQTDATLTKNGLVVDKERNIGAFAPDPQTTDIVVKRSKRVVNSLELCQKNRR